MSVLPKEIDYTQKLAALPSNTNCISVVIPSSNKSSFAAGGDIIQFDLGSRGFLVPGSLYLRYKLVVSNATTAATLLGTPFATPFARCETIIGNQTVESLQKYNQLYNLIVNTKLNHAQKAAMAVGLGLVDNTNTITYANLNGRVIGTGGDTSYLAAPLGCLLSNCDHLVPLSMMPAVRIQLTTDALASMFDTGAGTVTAIAISNCELCYDIVEFGPEVNNIVRSMADNNGSIYLKSQSYSSSSQTIASGAASQAEYVFNQRISSIKSLYAVFSMTSLAKEFGSRDVTTSTGDYQFIVGSVPYPPRPLSAANKGGMFMELLNAQGPAHSIDSNNVSITPLEWNRNHGDTETAIAPGKFIIATNVEKLSTNGALLTGISSQLSPISLRVNYGTTTTNVVYNLTLITNHDAILEVNVISNQVSVKV